MKFQKTAIHLINLFNALLWIMIMIQVIGTIIFFTSGENWMGYIQHSHTLAPILVIPVLFLIREPLFQIKKILYNIRNDKIFIEENVKRFKRISYPFFILAIGTLAIPVAYIKFDSDGSSMLKGDTFVLVILGFVSLIMSHIFAHAMNIQTEATQLKEETQLTI